MEPEADAHLDERARSQAVCRVDELRALLRRADDAYYVLNRPELPDAEYDARMRELQALEARFPEILSPDSPTQRIGGRPSELFAPVRHAAPMLSLDNAFTLEELQAWYARVEREAGHPPALFCEVKIDGLAVALTFEHGLFVRGATRGDGVVGEDVTANLRTLRDVPARLALAGPPARLEVRGEVYLAERSFEALNATLAERGERTFANPRNAAAGSLRQKDPKVTARRSLGLWVHGISFVEGGRFERHSEALAELARAGLPINPASRQAETLDAAWIYCRRWQDERHGLGYAIDGVVLKVDSIRLREELGATAKAPRWAIAFKLAPEERATLLRRIEVHTGRSGKVTPFAMLEPVFVSGARVSLATLHNEDEVRRKDVREGDTVVVRRAGEVIPEIVAPVLDLRPPGAQPWRFPRTCPSCGTPLVREPGEADGRCPNRAGCPSQGVEGLFHFASRGAMDIERLGYQTGLALLESGLVRDPADLFFLTEDGLARLPGFAERSIRLLLAAIERAKDRPLWRLLVALSIRHVGPHVAQVIARAFPSMEALRAASREEIERVEGIGTEIAGSLYRWMHAPASEALLEKLRRAGVRLRDDTMEQGPPGPLQGQTVVLTGTFESMSRDAATRAAQEAGAHVASSVSRLSAFLVAGSAPGSKLARARALGVEVIGEREFIRRLHRS